MTVDLRNDMKAGPANTEAKAAFHQAMEDLYAEQEACTPDFDAGNAGATLSLVKALGPCDFSYCLLVSDGLDRETVHAIGALLEG